MSAQLLLFNAFTLFILFMLPKLSLSDDNKITSPELRFKWPGNKAVFRAGENAAIEIVVVKDFKSEQDKRSFNPSVSMNGVTGNSSLVTRLWCDISKLRIFFIPIMVGKFNVLINDTRFNLTDGRLKYDVTPGPIYEPGGIVSWMQQDNECVAGTKETVFILPKDAYGNTVTKEIEGQKNFKFEVYAVTLNGTNATLMDISYKGWNKFGYICIEFVAATAGHLLVHIRHENSSLIDSPLFLTVHPGELDVRNCSAHWTIQTKSFQLFSIMETCITKRDKYGNLLPGLHEFDVEVLEKESKFNLPIGDLEYKEVSLGIQSLSFKVTNPGDFILIISDIHDYMTKVMNTPYEFTVFIGYCDSRASLANVGAQVQAGQVKKFTIKFMDAYENPSPVELERVQVDITLAPPLIGHVKPQIYLKNDGTDTQPSGMLSGGAFGPTGMTYVPPVFSHDNYVKNSKATSSEFEVVYVPVIAGMYEVRVYCGNIILNGGVPLISIVTEGGLNESLSGVVQYDKNAKAGVVNYISVRLMDSYRNPLLSREEGLVLHISSRVKIPSFANQFIDNKDGSYKGSYLALSPGYYEFSVSIEAKRLQPYPFGTNLFDKKSFPTVRSETIKVWEDQSAAFNVTEDDFTRGQLVAFTKPLHGSLLLSGDLFRYTPYKGFYGLDIFFYTISLNGINDTGQADLNVLALPPRFVSPPKQLQALEDTLSPRFGGFPSLEFTYSDLLENISVILTAQNGIVSLATFSLQLWDPMWFELTVSEVEGRDGSLSLTGRLEVINFALKSLQYTGNANFSGIDIIEVTTTSVNDKGYFDVPVYVEPVNDPPVINVPNFIVLKNEKENKGFLIFDREQDKFDFSIEDPDRLLFPENENHFRVMFSVEVGSGTFSAKLPAHLISTTELKSKISRRWKPLQTFVKISKHVIVTKVKGIRFRGTINECNTFLHQLIYYGDKRVGVLKLSVNDMGWYGRDPDSSEMFNMSVSYISVATVNLMTRTPISSLIAHSLGFVLVIESVLVASLALILIYYAYRCITILLREKKKRLQDELENYNEQMPSAVSPENTLQLTRRRRRSFSQSEETSSSPES